MKIKTGSFEVLYSGSVSNVKKQPIDFIIDETTNMLIRFTFIEDDINKDSGIKAQKLGINGLEIIVTNFNLGVGRGNVEPIKIGTIKGKSLFILFKVYGFEGGDKLLHYTFLTQN